MSEELKPCPLCGGEAHLERGAVLWAVVCGCASHVFYGCEQSKERTVRAWNTRAERTCRMEREPDSDRLWWCSSCESYHEHQSDYPWEYCPRCGAKVVH